ncbi:MAG: asparagine synthase (glutamine-hydrolyzing) [Deltaproteobacteria bacterium]|nr:asparagine synthase (glutamine-hydrolyzing) [Deltaproteobacteria bacterium]
MCGISGHIAFPRANLEAVRTMTAALAHRGPDGDGFYDGGAVALGHRRLAIIDLATGEQPIFNEDKTVAVVLNGEIYNYKELREELRAHHKLETQSDTEVLVHLYEDLGDRMVEKLRGMFAFALWDAKQQRLLIARDRFGEKPLVYAERNGTLAFASELRALVAAGFVDGAIDRDALSDYLELLYIPAPRSIYAGAKKLPAGHLLIADAKGVRIQRYWQPPVPGTRKGQSDAVPELRAALEEAVRLQLRSDVPVAAMLSGGLDSASVVALMARELSKPVRTFSVGFGMADDELPFARAVAERYKTEHQQILITDGVEELTRHAFAAYSEPFGDSSSVPTVAICREVAKHSKVVLTGDGGDELFAGYGKYRDVLKLPHVPFVERAAELVEKLPQFPRRSTVRRGAAAIGARGAARARAMIEVFSPGEREALLGLSRTAELGPELPSDADSAIAFDLQTYLPDDLLFKVDTASMRASLESRSPMLDHHLAELAIPLPIGAKQDATRGKRGLVAAMRDLLPPEILDRPKRGFGSPVDAWLKGPLRGMVADLLSSPGARVRQWLSTEGLDATLERLNEGRGNAHQVWALLAMESWAREFGSKA